MILIYTKFDEGIPCNIDALDKRYNFIFNGFRTSIILPCVIAKTDPMHKPYSLGFNCEHLTDFRFIDDLDWGLIYSYSTSPDSKDVEVFLKSFVIEAEVNEDDIFDYVTFLRKWLGILRSIIIIHKSTKTQIVRSLGDSTDGFISLFLKKEKWESVDLKTVHRMSWQQPSDEIFLDSQNFTRIINITLRNGIILLEYQLYVEALEAFTKGDFRRSIIESAIVIELTLTQAVTKQPAFIVLTEAKKKKELKKYSMLGNRIKMCNDYGVILPLIDFKNDVLDPRNSVAHQGYYPTEKESRLILKHAKTLLDQLIPL